jgi:hypothetical protein
MPIASRKGGSSSRVGALESEFEISPDLKVSQQEGSLVEPLVPKPARDLVVAFARVTRSTHAACNADHSASVRS